MTSTRTTPASTAGTASAAGAAAAGRSPMEIGVFSFGEQLPDLITGVVPSPRERLEEVLAYARTADQAGLDVFGVGEHHRGDFAISSPPVVLASVARETRDIRLTSAVTVLSSSDPVKVFEDFATLDLLSGGRAEITAGRGAFVESFPLFGYDTADYEELFDEHLDLLLRLREHAEITWSGRLRAPLTAAPIHPRPVQSELPVWVGVGGTPASAARAARLGLPMYLAVLGAPEHAGSMARHYRALGAEAGHDPAALRVGVTSHFYVEETSQGARDTFYPHYREYVGAHLGRGRAPLTRSGFDQWAGPDGALFAGSVDEIVEKMLHQHELVGHDRFLAQVGLGGGLDEKRTNRSIELLAGEVAPRVRAALAG